MERLKRAMTMLKAVAGTLLPNCREATRLQSLKLDAAQPLLPRLGLRFHLLVCRWCRRYGSQIRFLRRAVRENPEQLHETTPRTLSPEARDRIKQSLRDEIR